MICLSNFWGIYDLNALCLLGEKVIDRQHVSSCYWGLLLGVIFFNPIFALVGVAAGALSGATWIQ